MVISLPLFVSEEFAVHGDFDAVTFGVGNFLDVHGEINGAHDAGAEFFFDELFERAAVNVGDFLEAILEGFLGNRGSSFAFVGEFGKGLSDGGREFEEFGDFDGGGSFEGVFAKAGGGDVNFGEARGGSDGFPSGFFLFLRGENGFGHCGFCHGKGLSSGNAMGGYAVFGPEKVYRGCQWSGYLCAESARRRGEN